MSCTRDEPGWQEKMRQRTRIVGRRAQRTRVADAVSLDKRHALRASGERKFPVGVSDRGERGDLSLTTLDGRAEYAAIAVGESASITLRVGVAESLARRHSLLRGRREGLKAREQ